MTRNNRQNTSAAHHGSRKKRKINKRNLMIIILVVCTALELIIGSAGLIITSSMLKSKPTLDVDDFFSNESSRIFDKDGNRRPDTREDILRDENAPIHPSLRILSSPGRPQLRYLPDGRSSGSNLTVRLCREDTLLAQIIVNNAGRVRSETLSGSKPCTG